MTDQDTILRLRAELKVVYAERDKLQEAMERLTIAIETTTNMETRRGQ